jgi:hypothetical protein
MPFVRCPTSADAQTALDRVVQAQGDALFLFFGSEDPVTGASWCPDCVTADPVLRATIKATAPGLSVHECPVGLRSAWKGNMAHPYRVHPAFHLARIPTLIRFQRGIDIGRLVEASCADPAAVRAFLG